MILAHTARWLVLAAAAYTAATLARYYLAAPNPRFPVESAFFIFVGIGVVAVLARRAGPDRAGLHLHRADPNKLAASLTVLAAIFVLAVFMVYAPAMHIGLLSDDFVIARWAERFELVHLEATGFVRPGAPAFWWMLGKLPGDFAVAAHAANVVLHGVNAALVSLIALRLGLRRSEAVAAGAIFALFPGLSEAIVWTSGVQDVLMATLTLTAVALVNAERPKTMAAVVASVVGLLVKETAIVIPVLSALIMFGRYGVHLDRRRWASLAALAGVTTVYVVGRAAAGVPTSFFSVGDWRYFLKQMVANSFAGVGAPWTVEWGRTHAVLAVMRSVAILGLATAAFYEWRRNDGTFRAAAACTAWILAATVPVFSLFYIGPQLEGARYVYLSAAGFSILLGLLLQLAVRRVADSWRPAVAGLVAGMLVVPFVPAIRSDLRRWQAAAEVRDDILKRVGDKAASSGCTTFAAEGDADSIAGAYVFRHGLAEALSVHPTDPASPCRVVLKAGALTVERTP